jgi:4-amino-4-deoxy-L-arabinose transferase-like glycosyltransferase
MPGWAVERLRAFILVAFASLTAFGCVLRFWKLSGVGLWYDELWTVVGASNRPFGEMYRNWILGDAHPPGFFVFYFLWFKVVPAREVWARLPSAVAGVATVAYLLWATDRILSRNERLYVAALASLSYIYIFYALSVKQYSALLLLATVDTIAYLEIVAARRVDRRAGVTLTAASLALAYLNYFGMVYAAMLIALLLVTFRGDRPVRQRLLRIGLVGAVGAAPIAPFLYLQIKYNIDAWQPYEVGAFLADLGPSLFFNDPVYIARSAGILVLVLIVRVVVGWETRRQLWTNRNRHLALIVAAFGGFMLALGLFRPIFYVRYFLALAPAVLLVVGIATAAAFPLERGWPAIPLLAFFLHAAAIQFRSIDGLQREQWDKSVDVVLASGARSDGVYVLGASTDRTEFDYLRRGDVDGVFNVRNVDFYRYYFRRRGASETAAHLHVIPPTVEGARGLAARFHGTRATIYILGAHHLQLGNEALGVLRPVTRRMEVISMNSTLVYKLTFNAAR